jgi:hypothetical protein
MCIRLLRRKNGTLKDRSSLSALVQYWFRLLVKSDERAREFIQRALKDADVSRVKS